MNNYIQPNWPAPKSVRARTTTRNGGYSVGSFASFNLACHVGDDPVTVAKNRQKLRSDLMLSSEPCWLTQQHTTNVVNLAEATPPILEPFDAAYTRQPGQVCAVLTADCLPILLCDKQGTMVAAIHAGWRGLAAGVIEQTIAKMQIDTTQLMAWLGPAIGPSAFVVGQDVYQSFLIYEKNSSEAFTSLGQGKWLANIYLLARQQLLHLGIIKICGGGFCTYNDAQNFFSYRRDGNLTGRMASLIWLE